MLVGLALGTELFAQLAVFNRSSDPLSEVISVSILTVILLPSLNLKGLPGLPLAFKIITKHTSCSKLN
jgi:hypothetical protein